jgi:hypothetical protein
MAWWSFGAQKRLEETSSEANAFVRWESERYKKLQKIEEDLDALKAHLDNKEALASAVAALLSDVQQFKEIPLPPTSETVQKLFAENKLQQHPAGIGTLAQTHRAVLEKLELLITLAGKTEVPLVGGGPLDDIREAKRVVRLLMEDEATFIHHAK